MRHSPVVLAAAVLMAVTASCKKRDSDADANAGFLENASAEAKEALSAPVSYELNEENFARWEKAEQNLDRIPQTEFATAQPAGGSVVDRAVARIEASPRAKKAIEAAGLSVRDFVLETVALAQAVQASRTGRSTVASGVADANFAFVERYRDRIRQSSLEDDLARQSGDSAVTDPHTAAELASANADRAADSMSRAMDSLDETGSPMHKDRIRRDSSADTLHDSISIRPDR